METVQGVLKAELLQGRRKEGGKRGRMVGREEGRNAQW